jgi:cytochrome b6
MLEVKRLIAHRSDLKPIHNFYECPNSRAETLDEIAFETMLHFSIKRYIFRTHCSMFTKQVTDSKAYQWFNERLEIQALADDISSKYVPPHVNIFYCLGGITLTCFLIQFATGFAMTFYYKPTVVEAFTSVQYIMNEVNFGWLIRSIHKWSASMMVLMMILHVFRVYLTGGFKKPRELTWVTGVVLAVITVTFGVTGYSLPWDQVGYWAVKIVSGVPAAIPVVGDQLVELMRGSESVGQATLTRFYSLHTFVLPWAIIVFMLAHFLMIRKQGISGPL